MTTGVTVAAADAPQLGTSGFTIEASVALDAYPWNWLPLVDEEKSNQAGFAFGLDAFGHLGLQISLDGQWQTLLSTSSVPLKRWTHLVATYCNHDGVGTVTLYQDGAVLREATVQGTFDAAAKTDLLIGRVRKATLPFPEAEIRPAEPFLYSLDGLLDQVAIYNRALTADEVVRQSQAQKPAEPQPLSWQSMPAGPDGPGPFGAFYTTLHYQDTWDGLRRTAESSDVVVRFPDSPVKLVFWQGLNYVPAWVSENGKWYTDEFLEVWDNGCPDGGDCEPMSDKQERFSRVRILESSAARVVVHWRYALVATPGLKGAWADPDTGWFDWADEFWTVYPDGIAVRKQVLHSSHPNNVHEWQETIVLHQAGKRPEDDIENDAVTLGNMAGETRTYHWQPKRGTAFENPTGPTEVGLSNPNMQLVNIKSQWKPFQVVPPQGSSADFYNNEKSYSTFECWNHWPVAQIPSSDRLCVTSDRPSHSSLSHLFWQNYAQTGTTATKILMDGMTTKPLEAMLPAAKAWLTPAALRVDGGGYERASFDPAQRAWVIPSREKRSDGKVSLQLHGTENAPIYHPAFVIENWGSGDVTVRLNGKRLGVDEVRVGHRERLEGTDLLLWLPASSASVMQIELQAAPAHVRVKGEY